MRNMIMHLPNSRAGSSRKRHRDARAPLLVAATGTLLVVAAGMTLPSEAHAYLDAGTGSMLVQALIASTAAALIAVRTYWTRIKNFFGGKSPEADGDIEGNDSGH
jgi:hypothetical protein